MNGRLKLVVIVFYFFILLDFLSEVTIERIPVLAAVDAIGSVVTNTIEIVCFLVLLDYGTDNAISDLMKYLILSIVGVFVIFMLIGGVLI